MKRLLLLLCLLVVRAYGQGALPVTANPSTGVLNNLSSGAAPKILIANVTGGQIGVNVQAYSANLDTFAAIAPSANVITLLGSANYAAFRTSLGVDITALTPSGGTAGQALIKNSSTNYDYSWSTFTGTISGLSSNGMLYATGGTTVVSTAAPTNGQLLIGTTSGAPALATITGTSNQVVVTNGAHSITLSLPQSIATSSTPQFAGIGIGTASSGGNLITSSNWVVNSGGSLTTGTIPVARVTGLSTVATSGSYADLLNKPALGFSRMYMIMMVNFVDVGGSGDPSYTNIDISGYGFSATPVGIHGINSDTRIITMYDWDASSSTSAHIDFALRNGGDSTGTYRSTLLLSND